jgi:hypothetical protein
LKIEYEGYPLPALTAPSSLRQDQLEKIFDAIEAGIFKFKRLTPARLSELESEHSNLEAKLTAEEFEEHPGIHRVTKRKMAPKSIENLRHRKHPRLDATTASKENVNRTTATTNPTASEVSEASVQGVLKNINATQHDHDPVPSKNVLGNSLTMNTNSFAQHSFAQPTADLHNPGSYQVPNLSNPAVMFPMMDTPPLYQDTSAFSDPTWNFGDSTVQTAVPMQNMYQGLAGGTNYDVSNLYGLSDVYQGQWYPE